MYVFFVCLDKEALCWIYVWEPRPKGTCLWCERNRNSPSWWMSCCS